MAKKYSFKDSSCPFCGLELAGKQSEKLVDGKGACPQCAHSLELEGGKSQKPQPKVEPPAPPEPPATEPEPPAPED